MSVGFCTQRTWFVRYCKHGLVLCALINLLRANEFIVQIELYLWIIGKMNEFAQSETTKNTDDVELSKRETDVLVAVAKGMMNKEIADQMNISIHTVISHRKNITRKTGIKSVSGLTVYALLNNLIDETEVYK